VSFPRSTGTVASAARVSISPDTRSDEVRLAAFVGAEVKRVLGPIEIRLVEVMAHGAEWQVTATADALLVAQKMIGDLMMRQTNHEAQLEKMVNSRLDRVEAMTFKATLARWWKRCFGG
jgi:hypothetical protein